MSKEELERLKEELKKEILLDIEKDKYKSDWKEYMDTEVTPKVTELFPERTKAHFNLKEAISSIARTYNKKKMVGSLTKEEIEAVKPLIQTILNYFKEGTC